MASQRSSGNRGSTGGAGWQIGRLGNRGRLGYVPRGFGQLGRGELDLDKFGFRILNSTIEISVSKMSKFVLKAHHTTPHSLPEK